LQLDPVQPAVQLQRPLTGLQPPTAFTHSQLCTNNTINKQPIMMHELYNIMMQLTIHQTIRLHRTIGL